MEGEQCVFLGIKVKPGPIERHKLENYTLDHTVDSLKNEAEKKTNLPSASLELIHHGKILKNDATLQDSGVRSGEMVHVVKKKEQAAPPAPTPFSDAELQQLNVNLRTLGCTPNAPGWTRAMQLLNDESAMAEILERAPSLNDDCVTLSILHEVELLAALGANLQTMRRAVTAHPDLPHALNQLTRRVRATSSTATNNENVPTSGFAYSLEALSDDEEGADEEGGEGEDPERNPITQEQLAAALQAASEAVSSPGGAAAGGRQSDGARRDSLLRLLQQARDPAPAQPHQHSSGSGSSGSGTNRSVITPEMFSEAISEAISRAARPPGTPMDQSTTGSTTDSPAGERVSSSRAGAGGGATGTGTGGVGLAGREFSTQLVHMHEMGLLDDAVNIRALLIAAGDVNSAINLVFSGAITDD